MVWTKAKIAVVAAAVALLLAGGAVVIVRAGEAKPPPSAVVPPRPPSPAPAPEAAPAAPAPQAVAAAGRVEPKECVRLALEWLARTQVPGGGWRAETKGATLDDHVIASSFACLAFLGTGQKPPAEACAWLEKQVPARPSAAAIQAMFLCEQAGMFKNGRPAAETALARLGALQQKDGSWREEGADELARVLYPTVWSVLAMKSAKVGGLKQAGQPLQLTHDVWAQEPLPPETELMVCRQWARMFLGWKREDLLTRELAKALGTSPGATADARCLYARTLLAFQCRVMPEWCPHLESRLAQQTADGSFEPAGGLDRTTTTALLTLSGEIMLRFAGVSAPARQGPPTDVPKDF
jgi:hypothetical protein